MKSMKGKVRGLRRKEGVGEEESEGKEGGTVVGRGEEVRGKERVGGEGERNDVVCLCLTLHTWHTYLL